MILSMPFKELDSSAPFAVARKSGTWLLIVGGAASLKTEAGDVLIDTPGFPDFIKVEAEPARQFLNKLKSGVDFEWTFLSPAMFFGPGERTGSFRLGDEALLTAADGKSSISYEDFCHRDARRNREPEAQECALHRTATKGRLDRDWKHRRRCVIRASWIAANPVSFAIARSARRSTSNELETLNRIGRRVDVQRGQTLMWEGDDSSLVANVIDGVLKLSTSTADGREQIVGVVYPSDFIGRPFGETTQHSVTALSDARVCLFPRIGV